jgi:3-hydroxyisobutyrate dehydrogenase
MNIGFIGLGRMGLPMCARLAAAGFSVTAADARPELEARAAAAGANWGRTPASSAAGVDIVITMLPGPREVRDVMADPGGVLAAMPVAATWVDMSSNSPATGRDLAALAEARGIAVLDAPVGGGVAAAETGTLQLFVGGDREILDRCRSVLEVLAGAGRIAHVGGHGAGYTTKLLVNLLWFSQALASAEALLLAKRAGLELDVLRSVLAGSAASSTFVREDLGSLLDGDYLTSFGLDRCCEELSEITALARELQVPSELTQVVERTYCQALRRYGPVDGELMAIALLEERAEIRLRHDST